MTKHFAPINKKILSPTIRQALSCVGLHCSGSDGSHWQSLFARMGSTATTLAPDLFGAPVRGHYRGDAPFSLEIEAEPIIEMMTSLPSSVDIVGHSYGGALALHIARARPDLVRSLCLYEPTIFSILNNDNSEDQKLHSEIRSLTRAISNGIDDGVPDFSAQVFTDFWGGLGAWQALSRDRRAAMVRWIPKAPLDFQALLNEAEPENMLSHAIPTKIIVGSQTHPQTKRIAELLVSQSRNAELSVLNGACHLGPFTFSRKFEMEVLEYLCR